MLVSFITNKKLISGSKLALDKLRDRNKEVNYEVSKTKLQDFDGDRRN